MMQKETEKLLKAWHMGTHLRVLHESYPMNTNMTGISGVVLRTTASFSVCEVFLYISISSI